MTVREVMTSHTEMATPDMSLRDAARLMRDCDIGALPVGDKDRLVGMITDRDITIRAVAEGMDVEATQVREAMTSKFLYVFDDELIESAAQKMADLQVRRLPVLDRSEHLVGILALSDVSIEGPQKAAAHALRGVSEPSD
ncbi:MAG: CBS domain-containing protein [Candidatus Eisenbacteria bacterium]|nr:CBS domain-containing protein [Candidatus Eisenbacteria bacterium]